MKPEIIPQVPGESAEPEPKVRTRRGRKSEESAQSNILPDQSEIDPRKIDRAVLSRQGWVCPVKE